MVLWRSKEVKAPQLQYHLGWNFRASTAALIAAWSLTFNDVRRSPWPRAVLYCFSMSSLTTFWMTAVKLLQTCSSTSGSTLRLIAPSKSRGTSYMRASCRNMLRPDQRVFIAHWECFAGLALVDRARRIRTRRLCDEQIVTCESRRPKQWLREFSTQGCMEALDPLGLYVFPEPERTLPHHDLISSIKVLIGFILFSAKKRE